MIPCSHCYRRRAEDDSRFCRACLWSRPIDAGIVKPAVAPAPMAQRLAYPPLDQVIPQPAPGAILPGIALAAIAWGTPC